MCRMTMVVFCRYRFLTEDIQDFLVESRPEQ